MRKLLVALGLMIFVLAIPATAFANDCVNLSRPFGNASAGYTKGRWTAFDVPFLGGETWGFSVPDNFMNGQGDALLTNATCPTARLIGQSKGVLDPADLHGIWSEQCFEKALP
jgi:hypothetical protein